MTKHTPLRPDVYRKLSEVYHGRLGMQALIKILHKEDEPGFLIYFMLLEAIDTFTEV